MTPFHPVDRLKRMGVLVLLVAGLACSQVAQAQENLDYGKVYAIQPRAYRMNQEFSVGLAFLPLDAFYKAFVGSFIYVLHFDDLWAWENHFSFAKYLDIDTGLEAELQSKWDASPTDTSRLDYFFDTNLMLSPLYGKMTLFDKWVINSETYFLMGLGAQHLASSWSPAVDVGLGMRIFLSNTISLRFEVRDYVLISEGGVDNSLYMGVGFCYNAFASDRKVKPEEEDVQSGEVEP
jgi:outer membrane beta-barrel protein